MPPTLKTTVTFSEKKSLHPEQLLTLFQQAPWAKGRTLSDAREMLRHTDVALCAWDGDRLVGFGRVLTDFVYRATIWDVIVDEGYQKQGIGTEIVRRILHHPRLKKVELLAGYLSALKGSRANSDALGSATASADISGPGIAVLPASLRGLLTRSRNYIESLDVSGRLALYCIFWATITLVFFSASVSKLLPYTLPAFPALAILVGCEFERCLSRQAAFKRLAFPLLAVMMVYAAASLVAPIVAARLRDAPAGLTALISAYGAVQAAVVLISILAFKLNRKIAGLAIMTVGTACMLVVHTAHILPVLSQKWEGPLPKFSRFAGQSSDPLIVFDMRKPGVPFYALKQVENINNFDLLTVRLKQVPQAYILLKVKNMPLFKDMAGIKTVDSEGDFALLRYGAER